MKKAQSYRDLAIFVLSKELAVKVHRMTSSYKRSSCIMNRESCIVKDDGVTLVELMVVITILAVMLAFASLSMVEMARGAKLNEARDQLLADIQDAKLKSMSGVPHAIFIVGSTSYTVRKLKADDANFIKDVTGDVDGTPVSTVTMPSGMTIAKTIGDELWFDRKGLPKTSNWAQGDCSFTLTKGGETRTIFISVTGRIQYEAR